MMPSRTIAEWILDPSTCFLLGAGVSKCTGRPLMAELTEQVKDVLTEPAKQVLARLRAINGRPATVEDLINYLLEVRRLLEASTDEQLLGWSLSTIQEALATVQKRIVESMGSGWSPCGVRAAFLQRLAGQKSRTACDLFTLNYDTVTEATLESLRFPYVDGFRGAEAAFFDPSLFDQQPAAGPFFRVLKLHGSINWFREDDDSVRRKPTQPSAEGERLVIYPAQQKYLQTQYGVYETLLGRFRQRLRDGRANNKLVVLGYSFSDDHINVAIEDSIQADGNNLTVYAFVGPESDLESQASRLGAMVARCNKRLNFAIGGHAFLGPGLERDEWEELKPLDLWRFERLVEFLTGDAP